MRDGLCAEESQLETAGARSESSPRPVPRPSTASTPVQVKTLGIAGWPELRHLLPCYKAADSRVRRLYLFCFQMLVCLPMTERNFRQPYRTQWEQKKFLCIGLDSDLRKSLNQRGKQGTRETIVNFNRPSSTRRATLPALSSPTLRSTKRTAMRLEGTARDHTVYPRRRSRNTRILDAKRGDIANTISAMRNPRRPFARRRLSPSILISEANSRSSDRCRNQTNSYPIQHSIFGAGRQVSGDG